MKFSTSDAFNVEKKDVAFLDSGIHEDVLMTGIRKEKSQNGNLFIEFAFAKDGKRLTHTEFEPTKSPNQSDDEFNSKINNQVARVLQIMSVFYPKDVLSGFEGDSFDQFATWVKSLLDAADKTKLLRVKAVYSANGYVGLPKYSAYTFIESMDIAKENSKIAKLGIDVFDRPNIGDKEQDTKSAASTFGASAPF
jgi:hypothetical protein